ncbi:MAG: DUF5011 domain-containing protein, partial [Mariprofundaceae bacterium]|nr:DUF5011 domain-containing protein [Mariprofundaceae bacterium]
GSVYVDAGSKVTDNVDVGLVATMTGSVNTAVVGTYTLTYNVKDKAGNAAAPITRTVHVVNVAAPITRTVHVVNVGAPVITLLGTNPYTLAAGSVYVDAGSKVTDNVDVGLVATMTGSVNTAVVGTYTLTYNVKDKAGNAAAPITRTIFVKDQTAPVVTAPANITLTTIDAYGLASTDPYITAFLKGASALDNIDPVLTISNDAPLKFLPGPTVVTFKSTDKAGNLGISTATVNIQGRLFVGVTTNSILTSSFTAWEAKAGHKAHRIHHFYDFTTPAWMWKNEIPTVLNAGYSVVLTMQPTLGNANVSLLKDIYAGVMDPYIDASINGIKNNILPTWSNADIWMRFGHEMNGDWYPWGSDFNQGTTVRHLGNTAQDYINAYRHVVDRFRAAGLGSNMVKWVFSPNTWYKDNFTQFYPGDTYVDMISTSGFNFGTKTTLHPTLTWQTFNQVHQFTYKTLTTLYPNKPYFIAGISSAELGGPTGGIGTDKPAWIKDMSLQLAYGYPKMVGVFWFNIDKKSVGEAHWTIDSSPASLAGIQAMYGSKGAWKP